MSKHLLLVTLGPVQDFIAQARRTRDLWFGSHLLSELSRAAAKSLAENGAELIFPALAKGDPELTACDEMTRGSKPPLNVANKLLAVVPDSIDPSHAAGRAREAAMQCLRGAAYRVKGKVCGVLAKDADACFEEQIDSFLEFLAAWAPLSSEQGYAKARGEVEAAIAGRKNLRDFEPWVQQREGAPKSSLDGGRCSVLRPRGDRPKDLVQKYRIAENEQLDGVGLLKRAGGKPDQFVPITNVALACWIERASKAAERELRCLDEQCEAQGFSRVWRPDIGWTKAFHHDAQVFFPDRWRSLLEEAQAEQEARSWGQQHVRPILAVMSPPYPYVACLVADGDRMGDALSKLESPEAHRRFSENLAVFASRARTVVEREQNQGLLVYSGGDDVLAFVALPDALSCAEQLRGAFREVMKNALPRVNEADLPTLSIGIGVGHVLDGLGELLALGREAEKLAKGSDLPQAERRNGLAIVVDKRSGGKLRWRSRWDGAPLGAVERLQAAQKVLTPSEGAWISSKKIYQIRRDLLRLPAPPALQETGPGDQEMASWSALLVELVTHTLTRVDDCRGLSPDEAGLFFPLRKEDEALPAAHYHATYRAVEEWVARMLIAKTWLASQPRKRGR